MPLLSDGEFSRGRATECGLRHLTAPLVALVALAEDHSYPDAARAERVIASRDERWAAIGARVRNANPHSSGGRLLLDVSAVLYHWNPSVVLPSMSLWFRIGRCFGHHRAHAERWSMQRRVAYPAAAPPVALTRVRGQRLARRTRAAPPESLAYWAVLTRPATAAGLGESLGYVAGEGTAIAALNDFEFRRDRYPRPRDRTAFLA